MSESVSLPALGESVTEGTVTRWLKNVGDRVEVDEPLLEVSTDKVDTEIPSPVAGTLEQILVQEDETVEVGTALVIIGDGSGAGSAPAPAAEPAAAPAPEPAAAPAPAPEPVVVPAPAPAPVAAPAPEPVVVPAPALAPAPVAAPALEPVVVPAPAPAPAPVAPVAASAPAAVAPSAPAHGGTQYVTPIVRKIAEEQGVDLGALVGSGVGGRIRKDDVLAAASSAGAVPGAAPAKSPAIVEISPLRGTTQPASRLRKLIAERAVASLQATAQLTTVVKVDVTRVAELRMKAKSQFEAATGAKLSFLPFFALAAVEALKTYPVVNSTFNGETISYPAAENLSIAVDTERGLLTPVVRGAGDLTIAQLAQQIADLAERTRSNQLKPDELAGGTFTLTNTGSRGALVDTPLVFQPQSAILGTGSVFKEPAVVSVGGVDAIAIRSSVYLALSYDHRIVDGADAARYLAQVKARLEEGAFEANLGL
ncbi:2-oxo acid dehydrogenase subunit E2 [Gryllotalpicola sp.]|uniref:2-oxo acid dehydrogenase subunit E2 n=1 Tax=Gryllotalpicola sp. TaxID=1932787 RepID=UPI0026048A07|nr:2-oxo acid dehydrogenase subunit E2 [Gryllotalpicola sp.]